MAVCRGPHCGREIEFIRVGETLVPVDSPMREEVTRADGTKARAFIAHHSVCLDAVLFTKKRSPKTGD